MSEASTNCSNRLGAVVQLRCIIYCLQFIFFFVRTPYICVTAASCQEPSLHHLHHRAYIVFTCQWHEMDRFESRNRMHHNRTHEFKIEYCPLCHGRLLWDVKCESSFKTQSGWAKWPAGNVNMACSVRRPTMERVQ